MMSDVEIKGVQETLKNLEKKLGSRKIRAITKEAVDAGAKQVEKRLQKDMLVFKDKGYPIDEVVKTEAIFRNNQANAKIGWNGPHERYRIIHLNEWGYTRNGKQIRPRGFGVITKSLKDSEPLYFNTVAEEVKKNL